MNERVKYFISEHLDRQVNHGGTGNVDIERILVANNCNPLQFPYTESFTLKAKLSRFLYLLNSMRSIPAGAVIFFQFPLYPTMHRIFIRLMLLRKNIQLVCIIADIDGLKDEDHNKLANEIKILKRLQHFIVHNENMERWLKSIVAHANISKLNFFDFLVKPTEVTRTKKYEIVFAGNLQKSPFLESVGLLGNDLLFRVYGEGFTASMKEQKNITYQGVLKPEELPPAIEGSFGLVWDGTGIDYPEGSLGKYMHFISHHKLSLYIVCNLPVIVHEDAGSAQLVTRLGIGFSIKNLYELQTRINELSEEDYARMSYNCKPVAKLISEGKCLETALSDVLVKIERQH